jgi:2,4-diaminopentanoate dehydrogenase
MEELTMNPKYHKPRLAFYGCGQYGMEALRIAVKKGWPIVAAWNRAGPKVGQDVGRVAGLGRDLGVIIEDADKADFRKSGADVAINAVHDRLSVNLPAYKKMLNAGINVVCHGAEAYFPWGADMALANEIDALAKKNNASFTGSGIWDHSRIWAGLLVVGPFSDIKSFFHKSVTNAESANVTMLMQIGVSLSKQEYIDKFSNTLGPIGGLYKLIPHHVLYKMGYEIESVTERREPVLEDKPVYCKLLDKTLPPGTALGTRIIATVVTKCGVTAETHIELRIMPEGESEHMLWEVNGTPASKVRVDRTQSVNTSAACLVHRAPDILAAPPGVVLLSEMGPLKPHLFL